MGRSTSFEAPVLLAYSARNRSASCRIPFGSSPKAKRMEIRFPDPTANPYLCFSAMLMAGLDGIKNKIDPGDPRDEDLYELSDEELKDIPTVCGSLREALDSLKALLPSSWVTNRKTVSTSASASSWQPPAQRPVRVQ